MFEAADFVRALLSYGQVAFFIALAYFAYHLWSVNVYLRREVASSVPEMASLKPFPGWVLVAIFVVCFVGCRYTAISVFSKSKPFLDIESGLGVADQETPIERADD